MRRMFSEKQIEEIAKPVAQEVAEEVASDYELKEDLTEDVQAIDISMGNIIDGNEHSRFVEDDITIIERTGVSNVYGKWALSGTHLLIVLCLSLADTTALTNGMTICNITLPDWIMSKIYPIYDSNVDNKDFSAYASDYSSQTFGVYLQKSTTLNIIKKGALTLDKDRTVRIAFDLLIDSE